MDDNTRNAGQGRLTVVGTGIKFGAQTTPEAVDAITSADKVFYAFSNDSDAKREWIQGLNPSATSLLYLFQGRQLKSKVYEQMAAEIVQSLGTGKKVCAVFFGHPGVFCTPAHLAIARARDAGFAATMLPGVSAEDCLFADLGLDPFTNGLQSQTAQTFLLCRRDVDTSMGLVLWQVVAIGEVYGGEETKVEGFALLVARLKELYGSDHVVTLYDAPEFVDGQPVITNVRIGDLSTDHLTDNATMYIPPGRQASADMDVARKIAGDFAWLPEVARTRS